MSKEKKYKANIDYSSGSKLIKSILSGFFLRNAQSKNSILYLLFLAVIGIIYIGNSYYADSNIRKIAKINKDLKELHFEYITVKSDLINENKPSSIAKRLSHKKIIESTSPPYKIHID